jgi:hypothetical protein
MQARVVGEVGRHSWEQSPLLILHRFVPGNTTQKQNMLQYLHTSVYFYRIKTNMLRYLHTSVYFYRIKTRQICICTDGLKHLLII